VGFFGFELVGF